MNGTIYDFSALTRVAQPGVGAADRPHWRRAPALAAAPTRVGLISNPRSRRNKGGGLPAPRPDVLAEAPRTRAELRDVLERFAADRVDLLVLNGGDGTVRDVLTLGGDLWGAHWPRIAVLPAGKTNALALDLGAPRGWSLDAALEAARAGRIATRSPVAIERRDDPGPAVRGFLLGTGAFVAATELAHRTHRAGAFNGVAVGLALGWAVARTAFGAADGEWRRGERLRLRFDPRSVPMHGAPLESDGARYMLFASTLERLPTGIRPFGRVRPGLKALAVDAPPRAILRAVPALLAGSEAAWLNGAGYRRVDAPGFDVDLPSGFILDGEVFPGGRFRVTEAPPLRFVVP